jgi:hypothetical protein
MEILGRGAVVKMEVQKTPAYQAWQQLSDEHWDYWQQAINKYDFALQKPANTLFTRALYPGFYQLRLLKRELALNMQQLGQVTQEEVWEYSQLEDDLYFAKFAEYHLNGPFTRKSFVDERVVVPSLMLSFAAYYAKKPVSWLFMPSLIFVAIGTSIQHRFYTTRIGEMVDFTSWTIEKRKAQVWLQQFNIGEAKIPELPIIKAQLAEIGANYKS